jgi:hypothetical protein
VDRRFPVNIGEASSGKQAEQQRTRPRKAHPNLLPNPSQFLADGKNSERARGSQAMRKIKASSTQGRSDNFYYGNNFRDFSKLRTRRQSPLTPTPPRRLARGSIQASSEAPWIRMNTCRRPQPEGAFSPRSGRAVVVRQSLAFRDIRKSGQVAAG